MPLSQLLFSFEGRIPRSTFWLSMICLYAVNFAFAFLLDAVEENETAGVIVLVPFLIWVLIACVAAICIQVKRWHDRDKSGWWIFIGIIPIIGGIWAFIELGCLRGTVGPNEYGIDRLDPDFDKNVF